MLSLYMFVDFRKLGKMDNKRVKNKKINHL